MEFAVVAFSSLFAMVNPVSAAPIFVDLTKHQEELRRRIAIRACLTALATLALFATAGGAIFTFFGITVPAFKIVGGLIFTISSIKELEGGRNRDQEAVEGDPAVVPIGIPLIAGAGAISTVMVLAGQARATPHQIALAIAIGLNILATLVVFLLAPQLVRKMGPSGREIMSKVMALLTAVIGVQFIIDGGTAVIADLMKGG